VFYNSRIISQPEVGRHPPRRGFMPGGPYIQTHHQSGWPILCSFIAKGGLFEQSSNRSRPSPSAPSSQPCHSEPQAKNPDALHATHTARELPLHKYRAHSRGACPERMGANSSHLSPRLWSGEVGLQKLLKSCCFERAGLQSRRNLHSSKSGFSR